MPAVSSMKYLRHCTLTPIGLNRLLMTTCLLSLLCTFGAAPPTDSRPASAPATQVIERTLAPLDDARFDDWLAHWKEHISAEMRTRYCDTVNGEEIGWLMTPFLDGCYAGYLATGDAQWIERCIDWSDAWIKRASVEPDGYPGWPKREAAGTQVDDLNRYNADSLLGEAMALRPITLMAGMIRKTPTLHEKHGAKADAYLTLSKKIYEKWDRRGAWRETDGGGTISIVQPYGLDDSATHWTDGYQTRQASRTGFSHPDNKANAVARWLLALSDATGDPQYQQRAARWFRLQRSRMKTREDGTFSIWNYWEPAGPWDYKPDGAPKHWVGIHPNAGYYEIDVEAIVDAFEHGIVFTADDLRRLIATAVAEHRNWPALAPYDRRVQRAFEENMKPDAWGSLAGLPKYLAQQRSIRKAG